ncbi:kinesin-like protein KIN-1 isoform X2 [Benincasa hispida]|uniref:kinesin-like protein KIN-1 isoform X2 n=1 Tax=Benincasa hispida TaxID=102211 RepID=UPI0018FFB4C5|nr:kinesin-like protein KIN-1 isoform X2 [Benincasa hispida]
MSNITVCARFRPLSSKERQDHGDAVCVQYVDSETFIFKDEKTEELTFSFDRVFYDKSEQTDVYRFLAEPIVKVSLSKGGFYLSRCALMYDTDALNAVNGTIITFGQTGAGKTYSMEGPGILECDAAKKGLLPRVVEGIFECTKLADETSKYSIKLSMVEIYMEKVRDLFDLSRDNVQIKESKTQGIILNGMIEFRRTISMNLKQCNSCLDELSAESSKFHDCKWDYYFGFTLQMPIQDPPEALLTLSKGIANRAVGETQMNVASSRSHCIYIFAIQQESTKDKRARTGKLNLVDLAGSEKVEKTGAEGRVLEEAKTINKSLSALGNVINALTCGPTGRGNHIPYRDSKLTRILQDALGGNSRTALLCCCSPSPTNSSETLSTLRFGARAKHIKASPRVANEDKFIRELEVFTPIKRESRGKLLNDESLDIEHVQILEELFIQEGILFDPCSIEESELAYEDVTSQTISSLQLVLEELLSTIGELKKENEELMARVSAAELHHGPISNSNLLVSIYYNLGLFRDWLKSIFHFSISHYN